jgi:branched-chain amino acid transport system substrate-binding protein
MHCTASLRCLSCLLCVFSSLASAAPSPAAPPPSIKLGVVLSLTGDFAFFGTEARRGAELAAAELSSSSGPKLDLVFENDKCLPADGVRAYQKLRNVDQVDLIVGPGCTGAILAVAPLVARDKKYMIALFDANEEVERAGSAVYVIGFDSEDEGSLMADHLAASGVREVGVIYEGDAWATVVKEAFVRRFRQLGGKIAAEEMQLVENKDYRSVITKVMGRKPEALYFVPAYNGGHFMRQLRGQGLQIPVFGPDTMGIQDVVDVAGEAAEGVVHVNVAVSKSPLPARRFLDAFRARYGSEPRTFFYAAMGYDAVRTAYHALASGKAFPGAFAGAVPDDSALGIGQFNPRRQSRIPLGFFRVEQGRFVALEAKPSVK